MVGQMTYLLHLHYGDWQHDTLTFQYRAPLLQWLRSGLLPREAKIEIEHKGVCKPWVPKPMPLAHKRTPQLERLLAAQKEDNISAFEFLEKCRELRGRKSV